MIKEKHIAQKELNLLAVQAKAEGNIRTEVLLVKCKGLIFSRAKDFLGYGFPIDDLVQVASIGFLKAIENFNPEKGNFSSFSVIHMRASLFEYCVNNFDIIKVATTKSQRKMFFNRKLFKSRGKLSLEEIESISKKLDIPKETVIQMFQRMYSKVRYLDQEITEGGGSLYDTLPSKSPDPCLVLESKQEMTELANLLGAAFSGLDFQEKDILNGFFIEGKTLEELASEWGLSHERVRQKKEIILKKVRAMVA